MARRTTPCLAALSVFATLALASVAALAQPEPEEPGARAERSVRLGDVPPPRRLGLRAASVLGQTRVVPQVVIVESEAAYLDAISHWNARVRFPILIDDGSVRARQHIARFVRAFEPERVVRYEPTEELDPFRGAPGELHDRLIRAQADIWGVPEADADQGTDPRTPGARRQALHEAWRSAPVLAPGVVVTHGRDRAWPAAIALAAARAQPLVFLDPGKNVNAALSQTEAGLFARRIEQACAETGFAWDELGDRLDAVTICLNIPAKVRAPGAEKMRALTDVVGRHADDTDGSRRWGWSAQVFGTGSDAAYQAMSSLFIGPSRALLFDGYPETTPWSKYDASPAADLLAKAGLETTLHDAPDASARAWRLMASRPVSTDLIFVNSKGNRDFFDLEPGRAHPGDIPLLNRPAIVHFIHSWSAVQPARRETVAGRWFDRGVIAYLGAVHEPYLQAFLPPETVVARLLSGYPWAVAPRFDNSRPWKVAVFGDPLLTIAGRPERDADATLPLEPVADLAREAADAMSDRRFLDAVERFAMLARDQDVATLISALLREQPGEVSAELAGAAFMAVTRAGSRNDQIALFRRVRAAGPPDPIFVDALWLTQAVAVNDPKHADETIALLAQHVREGQEDGDGILLARAMARNAGPLNPVTFLRSLDPGNKRRQRAIQKEIERLGGGSGG